MRPRSDICPALDVLFPGRFGHWYGDDGEREQCGYCLAPKRRPGIFSRVTGWGLAHVGALMGVSLVGWLLAIALAALVFLPGCFNAAETGRVERAHEQAQIARETATLQYRRGEIDEDTFRERLERANEVEAEAQAQATSTSAARWIGDLFDPTSLVRDLLLVGLGIGASHKVRDKSRAKALAALVGKERGP